MAYKGASASSSSTPEGCMPNAKTPQVTKTDARVLSCVMAYCTNCIF